MRIEDATVISETKEMLIYYGDPGEDLTMVVLDTVSPRQCICLLPSGAVKRVLYFVDSPRESFSDAAESLMLLQQDLVDSLPGNQ